MERQLGEQRDVRAAPRGFVEALVETAEAVRLPEDLADEGDGQPPIGPLPGAHRGPTSAASNKPMKYEALRLTSAYSLGRRLAVWL